MNKKLLVIFLMLAGPLSAGPIADTITGKTVSLLYNPATKNPGIIMGFVRSEENKRKIETAALILLMATNLLRDIEDFVQTEVPTLEAKGNKLISDFSCSGVDTQVCIANILSDTVSLIKPITNRLIARPNAEGNYDAGALFFLVSLFDTYPKLSDATRAKLTTMKTSIASFAKNMNGAMDFAASTSALLNPASIKTAENLSSEDKKALEAAVKVAPVKLEISKADEEDLDALFAAAAEEEEPAAEETPEVAAEAA